METTRCLYRIDPGEIAFFMVTVESYDGMAVVSTIDPHEALVELRISPGCEGLIAELLKDLMEREQVMGLAPIGNAGGCASEESGVRGERGPGGGCQVKGRGKGAVLREGEKRAGD